MRLLELFSGTGSVGTPFREHGWEVIAVDMDDRFGCEIQTDILTWDYTQCPTPDVVWSSPPCILYSCARTRGAAPDLAQADLLVAKTLEIIAYFTTLNPNLKYFIENPLGKLKDRPLMEGLPYDVLDYCMYNVPGGYRKRTCLWHNTSFVPRPLCCLSCTAPKHGNAHWRAAQRGGQRHRDGIISPGFSLDELHALPQELCVAILESV
jgi:hypothetical protein